MGTIYTVTDSASLYNALAKAKGGDEIKLAAGDYGDLTLNSKSGFDITFDAPVKITSLDPKDPATISSMSLNGVSNLSFDNVVFDYTFEKGDQEWEAPFTVTNSSGISIANSVFDGDVAAGLSEVADGFGIGRGLFIRGSDDVTVTGTEFFNFHRGLVASESTNLTLTKNDLHSLRSDGMNFAEVKGVLIEGNHIHDFKGSAKSTDHMDMIQFWTSGTSAPSSDITIRGNTLDIGKGDMAQSIFMRNELVDMGKAGAEMNYRNILIEENTILNGHSHGITVGETSGLTIKNNSVLSIEADDARFFAAPAINLAESSTGVVVKQNAVVAVRGAGDGAQVSGNAYIQNTDPNEVGYYGDQFIASSTGGSVADYRVASGSMLDKLDAGVSSQAPDATATQLTPQFNVYSSGSSGTELVFDASPTVDGDGKVSAADATFIWDFGDGTKAEGISGTHTYDKPGKYQVTLTVKTKDGTETKSITSEADVAGRGLLSFNAETGAFDKLGYGDTQSLDATKSASVQSGSKNVLDLGGTGTKLEIRKEDIAKFFGNDGFEMSMSLQADQPGDSWGEIARIHGSMIVSVQKDGAFNVRLFPEGGAAVTLVTKGTAVNDGKAHNVFVRFNGDQDRLEIIVDGKLAAATKMEGEMPAMGSWGLVFGEPWGGQNFDGKVSAFALDANVNDYPLAPKEGGALKPVVTPDASEVDTPAPDASEVETPAPAPSKPEPAAPAQPEPEVSAPVTDISQEQEIHELPKIDDFIFDIKDLSSSQLKNGASVEASASQAAVQLEGGREYVKVGRLEAFEEADQLSFSVNFKKASADGDDMRLVWNHMHVGLTVQEDGLQLHIGQMDNPFHESIMVDNLGLDDTELHKAKVVIDDTTDRLQIVLDDKVVYEEQGKRDIEVSGSNAGQWGWMLGSPWGHEFEGEIHDFRVEAAADFLPQDDPLLLA